MHVWREGPVAEGGVGRGGIVVLVAGVRGAAADVLEAEACLWMGFHTASPEDDGLRLLVQQFT